jgi:hypothetical protein
MKKIALIIYLSFSQLALGSQWLDVGDIGAAKIYLDADSVDKSLYPMISYWKLADFSDAKLAGSSYVNSLRSRETINCKTKQYRVDQSTFFTGKMATGQPIQDRGDTTSFTYIAPDTVGDLFRNLLCKK